MELLKDLKWRYAVKKFDGTKQVDEQLVNDILEAGNLSATSLGMQAYRLILVKDKNMIAKLSEVTYGEQLQGASHVIVLAARTDVDANFLKDYMELTKTVRPTLDEEKLQMRENMIAGYLKSLDEQGAKDDWAARQIYIVLGTLLAACANVKVDSCPMEGIQKEKYDEILDLASKNLKTVVSLPIGYRADEDHHKDLPKMRRTLDEMVVTF